MIRNIDFTKKRTIWVAHLLHPIRGWYAALWPKCQRACQTCSTTMVKVPNEGGPGPRAPYSWKEDQLASWSNTIVCFNPTTSKNPWALQHAISSISHNSTFGKLSAILEGLPDIQSWGGLYEVGTICTDSRVIHVRYGRDTTKHRTCRSH